MFKIPKLNPMFERPKYYIMNPIMLPKLKRADVVCKYTCLSCLRREKCKRDLEFVLMWILLEYSDDKITLYK